jgi:hypothetical protein
LLADAAIFVSKRLQRACFAVICLVWAQLALAACEPPAGVVRIELSPHG